MNKNDITENAKKRWLDVYAQDNGINDNRELSLSKYYSFSIDHDIKHLNFVFSRYKFAAKMLEYRPHIRVLDLGCNHGMGMQFFSQIDDLVFALGVDFDSEAIQWAKNNFANEKISFLEDDFLGKDYKNHVSSGRGQYDAVISIDVIEHIPKEQENLFLETLRLNLRDDGVAIIGTPNITMSAYASKESQLGHVNLFDQKRLYKFLSEVFQNVFIFSMTDEVVHTGFAPMGCYIMAVCAGKK